jgi:glycosyltransferase involved in cell wall biosynthesis
MSLSIIIPVFNSEDTLEEVITRIVKVMNSEDLPYEIILIDDASTDNSWEKVINLAKKNQNIIGLQLLKNSGQHSANLCGFRHSKNDIIITMDDDLQNPPEEIPKLIKLIVEGNDLVYGQFSSKKHNLFRSIGSKVINKLNKKIFNIKSDVSLSNFRAIDRRIIDLVCVENHFKPYIPGLILKYSQNIGGISVQHDERRIGKSNYTLRKLISLVFDLLFQHSTIPLRITSIIGLLSSFFVFIFGIYTFYRAIAQGVDVPGWASIAILLSLSSGLIILIMSVIGEYLIRILNQVSHQDTYKISRMVNFDDSTLE